MKKITTIKIYLIYLIITGSLSCKIPVMNVKKLNTTVPNSYTGLVDTVNNADIQWRLYYKDPNLTALIDSALQNNQELNILLQEIASSKNEVTARKGEYLPFVNLGAAAGPEKSGRYTFDGISEEDIKANPGREPKYLGDYMVGAYASWELDIWKKLRNAKKSALMKYLSTVEGRNFMVTNLVAEIAASYYELMGLDNLLEIIHQNILIQDNALRIIKLEKEAAKVSQLAVNRFDAQLLNTKNLQFDIQQKIVEIENRINFLVGRFPQHINRQSNSFNEIKTDIVHTGIPSSLLANRPDIRQAEFDLSSAKLDVDVARANFYPSVRLTASIGLNAFNPAYIFKPASMIYNFTGDLIAPLINKNAINTIYKNANLKQIASVFNYEKTILAAYIDVLNQLAKTENYLSSYETKLREVEILSQSILISNDLFVSARADYIEVLLTQREALESKIDLIEIKLKQLEAKVNIYRALGGGWK